MTKTTEVLLEIAIKVLPRFGWVLIVVGAALVVVGILRDLG